MFRTASGLVAWALFLGCPLLAWLRVLPPSPAFYLFALGGLLGAVAALAGGVAWWRGMRDWRTALALSAVAAPFVAIALGAGGRGYPLINDISTDLADPPPFVHAASLDVHARTDLDYPEAFKQKVRAAYTELGPLETGSDPDVAYRAALELAQAWPGWTITSANESALSFEGIAETKVFGWKDDFVVRIRPEAGGSRIDMRSRSREGRGDLGANASRIQAYFLQLRPALPD